MTDGEATTGTLAVSPVAVVTGTIAPLKTGAVIGTISVGVVTAVDGTTRAGTVNPGSLTVTVAPKNPPLTLTGGTYWPAQPAIDINPKATIAFICSISSGIDDILLSLVI
jgi:hypothetical protein